MKRNAIIHAIDLLLYMIVVINDPFGQLHSPQALEAEKVVANFTHGVRLRWPSGSFNNIDWLKRKVSVGNPLNPLSCEKFSQVTFPAMSL